MSRRKLLPTIRNFAEIEIVARVDPAPRVPNENSAIEAWYAVRQEWTVNGGRVTPELLHLEREAERQKEHATRN